ncbi:hypothetical protein LCGC14_2775110 [marine sediment metagenome]|uniref:HAD family phosphatase n=1 Tax=marine sediment metagenome TaxID=412755 RepID=A0A0F9BLG4_9ZZZZ
MNNLLTVTCKALIFDMDGTMIDNMMVHHRAWQRKLKTSRRLEASRTNNHDA